MKHRILKYVVSTNVDGLHRRSGIPEEAISELHGNHHLHSLKLPLTIFIFISYLGNVYREVCSNEECKREYLRNFDVTKSRTRQRYTGRLCNHCGSKLVDSIINFGENLPKKALADANQQSSMADVTLVIGSSMRVRLSPLISFSRLFFT